jgi:hypothetical protein
MINKNEVKLVTYSSGLIVKQQRMVARLFSLVLMLSTGACVDRIDIETDIGEDFPIAVEGFITDEPGPYKVEISKSFDMESKESMKAPISAKKVSILDDLGYSEDLVEISQGIYQTNPNGIRGEVGRAYKVRIQLLDGRIYESVLDTLKSYGSMDSVYHEFVEEKNLDGVTNYGFNVFFDANAGSESAYYFLWKFKGTFQVDTNPELYDVPCGGETRCPSPRPCSSYVIGVDGNLEYVKPCDCCTCWVDFFNDMPVISDNQFVDGGKFTRINATYVPVNQWTFMYKVHAEVKQFTLSRQAFNFWKALVAQKKATASLFQPVTGIVKGNFIQISGEPGKMEGLFYASSVNSKSMYITRKDVPVESMIPPQDLPYKESCTSLFPYSTTEKPLYWD